MAKGRTNSPLTIAVHGLWFLHAAVQELASQGHRVHALVVGGSFLPVEPDWIMHPAAGWTELFFTQHTKEDGTVHRPFVEARLKAERARKRGKR